MSTNLQLVQCNCPDLQSAEQIATALLEKRQAACVNIMPPQLSLYRWQGKLERQQEVMLLIKAPQALFSAISQTICQLHPYTVPEIIALQVTQAFEPYLNWINEETSPHD